METLNRKKPILIIGGQGVGKTTKARELAGVKPGQVDQFGIESTSGYRLGFVQYHYKQFGDFRIVDDIFTEAVLAAVCRKAAENRDFRYIAISQSGGFFEMPEELKDCFEIIDLGSLQDAPGGVLFEALDKAPGGVLFEALDKAPGFVRYEAPAATLYGERAVVSIRQEGGQDQFRITLAKTKRGDVKACSLDRKELEDLRDNINHVLNMPQ